MDAYEKREQDRRRRQLRQWLIIPPLLFVYLLGVGLTAGLLFSGAEPLQECHSNMTREEYDNCRGRREGRFLGKAFGGMLWPVVLPIWIGLHAQDSDSD